MNWFSKNGKRHDVILSTMGCHPALDNRSVSRVLPKNIHQDLLESLEHLQTDYMDLYFPFASNRYRNSIPITPEVTGFPIVSFSLIEQMYQGFESEKAQVPSGLLDCL